MTIYNAYTKDMLPSGRKEKGYVRFWAAKRVMTSVDQLCSILHCMLCAHVNETINSPQNLMGTGFDANMK
jgi:hypothetical protein